MYLFLHFIFENTTNSFCCTKYSTPLDLPAVGSLNEKLGVTARFCTLPV